MVFDSLIARFPNMMIDACAAGGGRNDLETMRRAVPLHKSDSGYHDPEIKMSMNTALFLGSPISARTLLAMSTACVRPSAPCLC